jgi:hypothetical protein
MNVAVFDGVNLEAAYFVERRLHDERWRTQTEILSSRVGHWSVEQRLSWSASEIEADDHKRHIVQNLRDFHACERQ